MSHVWTQRFGDARVSVISEGTAGWPMERALEEVPEAEWRAVIRTDAEDRVPIGFNVVHVALPDASLLLDTGWGAYVPTGPAQPTASITGWELTPGLEAGLASLGVRPEAVTHVLVSHMHWDHIIGATKPGADGPALAFPNARHYVMAAEWADAPAWHQKPELIEMAKAVLQRAGAVELLAGERDILPGVRMIPSPGESPGHAVVRIERGGEVIYYLGDLVHQAAEFLHPDWQPRYRDRAAMRTSRGALFPRFVEENALLIVAHMAFPAIGRIQPAGAGYRWVADEGSQGT